MEPVLVAYVHALRAATYFGGAELDALRHARDACTAGEPAPAEVVLLALHATLDALKPPGELFGTDGYIPDVARRAAFVAAAAPRLELVALLLGLLPPVSLFPPRLARDDDVGAWPHGGLGVHDGGAAPGPRAALVAASFAGGASLAPDAAPADGLPPWSSDAAALAAEGALYTLAVAFGALPACSGLQSPQQAALAASLAARAPTLRQALVAPDARSTAPAASAFDAVLAAQALRSALSRLGHPHATDVFPAAFPCLLLALEHTASAPRTHGQLAAKHVAGSATRTALRARAPPLWRALLAGLPGCEAEGWPHAVHAAVAVALALAGDDPSAEPLHDLLARLTDELSLRVGDTSRAGPILAALPGVLRVAGIHALRHTSRLVPLLSEWMAGDDADCRAAAACALTVAMEFIWPRAEHHVASIWPAMVRGWSREVLCAAPGSHVSGRAKAAMLRLAGQLHWAGGDAFACAHRGEDASALVGELGELLGRLGGAHSSLGLPAEVVQQEPAAAPPETLPDEFHGAETPGDAYAQPDFDANLDAELAEYLADDSRVSFLLDKWADGDTAALLREARDAAGAELMGPGPPDDLPDGDAMGAWLNTLSLTS
jgi:hypothetical protein